MMPVEWDFNVLHADEGAAVVNAVCLLRMAKSDDFCIFSIETDKKRVEFLFATTYDPIYDMTTIFAHGRGGLEVPETACVGIEFSIRREWQAECQSDTGRYSARVVLSTKEK